MLGAKARAAMDGRTMPDIDVLSVALAVLRHRIVVNFQAEGAAVTRLTRSHPGPTG